MAEPSAPGATDVPGATGADGVPGATGGRVRAIDRLLAGYLLLSAGALAFPHRPDAWPVLLLVHVAIAGLLLAGAAERARGRWGVAVDWYPLLLMPFLYWELPFLSQAVWDGRFFDGTVLAWEAALFDGQPSASLARRWDSRLLSEVLHGAYLAYYPVIYLFPAALHARGQDGAFRATVFAIMLGFTTHYIVFTLFPVQGPRYLFPAPGGPPADGFLYQLAHRILESGSSQGAAFPSSHAAVAAVQTVNAARFLPAAVPLLALITVGIAVGAVYGGFHYGVDVVVGVVAGLLAVWAAPTVRTWLA